MVNELGNKAWDSVSFATLLSGISLGIRAGDPGLIEIAEKVFEQSFKLLEREPDEATFTSMINCYGAVLDIESCMDLLRSMLSNANWPNPSSFSYSAVLKALTWYYDDPMSYEQGWKYVDEILKMMKENDADIHPAVYGLLFNLCGGRFCGKSDMGKLYKFYDEMRDRGLRLNPLGAYGLLMAGVDNAEMRLEKNPDDKDEIQKELKQHIDWVMKQYQQYNLQLSRLQQEKLENRLAAIL